MTSRASGRSIVVGVTAPGDEHAALAFAAVEARLSGCGLRLVHAYTVPPSPPDGISAVYGVDVDGSFRDSGQMVLDAASAVLGQELGDLVTIETVLERGAAARILTVASASARLVVLGPDDHRPWFLRLFMSRVSRTLVESASCPVVVVPDSWAPGRSDAAVTLLVDSQTVAHGPLHFAFDHAARHGQPLHVVHVDEPHEAEGLAVSWHDMSQLIESWGVRYPDVRLDVRVVRGDATSETAASLASTGLLVLGRPHGQHVVVGFHDSLARSVIEHADCPVAVVPADYDG